MSLVDRVPVPHTNEDGGDAIEVVEVRLSMFEFGYGPEVIEVPVGATVRFIFVNDGAIEHEAIVGDMATQRAQRRDDATNDDNHTEDDTTNDDNHTEDDTTNDDNHTEDDTTNDDNHTEDDTTNDDNHTEDDTTNDDHGDHGDVPVLVLAGGATGDLVVTFDEVGEFLIGCHIPGHWESGMRATISVVEPPPSRT